jgi:tRNA(adenine34) deaminase
MTRWPLPEPMRLALQEARSAADAGEVPIGAVVVKGGQVIATAHNLPRTLRDPTAHAEMLAIRAAAQVLGQERLDGCDLWVTLEPCAMCAGAIVHARLDRVYYAAPDPKGGAVEHGGRIFEQPACLHRPEVYSGMGEGEAAELLRGFFRERRG